MIKRLLFATAALVLMTAVKPSELISKNGKPTEVRVSRAMVDAALANLPFELMNARAEPLTNKDGSIRGYQILEINEGSIYDELGLISGDSILAVDGKPVKSVADAMKLFAQLKGSSKVKILLERNGIKQQVTYLVR